MCKQFKSLAALLLSFAMLLSITGTAFAIEPDQDEQTTATTENPTDQPITANTDDNVNPDGEDVNVDNADININGADDDSTNSKDGNYENSSPIDSADEIPTLPGLTIDPSGLVFVTDPEIANVANHPVAAMAESICPTYQEAYELMIALKETYPEGMLWTNFTPYGSEGPLGDAYWWKGGSVKGASGGVGCAAFAFKLSDAAFDNLPARVLDYGQFTFEDVKVGDILRVNNSHFVIILQKSASGVIVAEGNYNKSVHWGRAISAAEVENSTFIVTRYPANFDPSGSSDPDEIIKTGIEGSLSWTLSRSGTLTISGNGAMDDFSPNDGILPSWNAESFNTIVIENGITSIGAYAFYNSRALSAYLSSSIIRIGQSAFRDSALLGITIPGSVQAIENSAFRGCANLVSASIANGIQTIGDNAFHGCTSLQYIDFPASITVIGAGAFMDCNALSKIRFESSNHLVTIGDNIFTRCQRLVSVTLPQMMDCISDGMFSNCNSLTYLYIPAGVSSIYDVETVLSSSPFAQCPVLSQIDFGGSQETWINLGGARALNNAGLSSTQVNFNVPFNDPLAPIPDDPGDLVSPDQPEEPDPDQPENPDPDQPEEPDPDQPVDPDKPENPDPNQPEEPDPDQPEEPSDPKDPELPTDPEQPVEPDVPGIDPPSKHVHNWSSTWSSDASYHWHNCNTNDCPITDSSQKNGYALHVYGNWVTDVVASAYQNGSRHRDCTICEYRQTETIPATGGSSGSSTNRPSGSSGSSSNSNSSTNKTPTTTTTGTKQPTTTTVVDQLTGIKTETTLNPDGSTIEVTTQKNGTTTTVTTDSTGKVTTSIELSVAAVDAAAQNRQPIVLPMTDVTVSSISNATPIAISAPQGESLQVTIPVDSPTLSSVVVVSNPDGSTKVLPISAVSNNSITASLPNHSTVKVIDNHKNFVDITSGSWYEDAVDFVSARELFAGTTATTFSPETPMTRSMLMIVLARLDGVNDVTDSLSWAISHGISDGSNPSGDITREQLVTMLWRYLGEPKPTNSASSFTDSNQISTYAADAMNWAVQNGIINGFGDGKLQPQGKATRAQVATILKNLIENILLNTTS